MSSLSLNLEFYDYINPYYKNKGGHPILLSTKIIKSIITENKNDLNLKEYLKKYSQNKFNVNDKNVLVNINTINEYNKYLLDFRN